jgi:CMP-2-keto-3-deoxyoctulosonic acid synthetase
MKAVVIIPARMASTRLPGKPRSGGQASEAMPSGRATNKNQGQP